ncbi:hypothetical protein [Streptomyces sp. NPDC053755]|uniref:hypothetical protein n=1 Tax=Streptomyces sp. NPDC053755 TaxID=3155815 RepID=UPI00343F1C79
MSVPFSVDVGVVDRVMDRGVSELPGRAGVKTSRIHDLNTQQGSGERNLGIQAEVDVKY